MLPPKGSLIRMTDTAEIDAARLLQINQIEGLTIATMPTHALVRARNLPATSSLV